MTPAVKSELESLNIAVPTNMTHFFQPLDLTVNGSAEKQFITHCSSEIDSGKAIDDIYDFMIEQN